MREWAILDSSFLPWPLSKSSARPGACWTFGAVASFVDIAGFTTLSEALGAHGPEGTEQLHEILNEFFGGLIELAAKEGGRTVAFAGDSATVIFPATDDDVAGRARRASEAVQTLAGTIRNRITLAGPIDIEVKIGLGAGSIRARVLGDEFRRRPVFDGSALEAAVAAEHGAVAGEVCEYSSLGAVPLDPPPDLSTGTPTGDDVRAFLHPAIAERLPSSAPDLMAEHRVVTAMFCGYDIADSGEAEFLRRALDIADDYGGHLLDVEHGDKGAKFLMLFGAPVAHADSVDRAMSAALACQRQPLASTHIGVSTGRCFAGMIGTERRRVWTVVGDTVNLAARLMQLAEPHEIQTDTGTATRATARFKLNPAAEPIKVKGKDRPVHPHLLAGASEGHDRPLPSHQGMVGRGSEQAALASWLASTISGDGSTVSICGPAGIGKSTLAASLTNEAAQAECTILMARFDLLTRTDSYGALRVLLRSLLDDAGGEVDERDIRRMVLNALLDPADSTAGTLEATPEERRALAHSLVGDLLTNASRRTPHVLLLDDCQWIDPASNSLAQDLARLSTSIPLMILLLTRPHPLDIEVDHQLELDELGPDDAASIARVQLPDGADESVVDAIGRRAGGNPLFVEELARQFEETGEVSSAPTLADAVAAAVDRVPVASRDGLKLASVLGRSFPRGRLSALAEQAGQASHAEQAVVDLLDRGMLISTDGDELQFRHDTLHEVTYDLLPFARRAALHEQVGELIETDGADLLDEIAFHYGRSRNVPKQRTYFRLAGDRAADLFTVATAIDYYRRLREITAGDEAAYADLQLGSMLEVAGQWPEAIAALRSAAEAEDPSVRAPAQARAGRLLQSTGERGEADALLRDATIAPLPAVERLSVLADVSLAAYEAGDVEAQIALAEEGLRLTDGRPEFVRDRAEVIARLASALDSRGEPNEAEARWTKALWLARDSGDRRLEARVLCDLAHVAAQRGDLGHAVRVLTEAHQLAEEIKDRPTAAMTLGNISDLLIQGNRLQRGYQTALSALIQVLAIGDRVGVLFLLGNCGRTLRELGRFEEASSCLHLGLAGARNTGFDDLGAAFEFELGVLAAASGNVAAAESWFVDARSRTESAEVVSRSSMWIALSLAASRPAEARRIVDHMRGNAKAPGAGDLAYVRWKLTDLDPDRQRALRAYQDGMTLEDGPELDRRLTELGGAPRRLDIEGPLPPATSEDLPSLLDRSTRLLGLGAT